MKKSFLVATVLFLISAILPYFAHKEELKSDITEENEINMEQNEETKDNPEENENESDSSFTFKVCLDGEVQTVRMDEYLPGVLAAEMPASFPLEALKAQAVAARSFMLYRLAHPPADGVHDGAALCNDPAHCKGHIDIENEEIARARYGAAAQIYVDKFRRAVSETDGQVMVYDGEPILAAFHAISGGRTENAADVWGGDAPYLVSVESPGEEDAEKFTTKVSYTIEEYKKRLETLTTSLLSGDADTWITDIERSEAGGVIRARVGGEEVKGTAIRAALSLNSTDFSLDFSPDSVTISVVGYGHGVGMSQYGARAMALGGADYTQILSHYYTGAVLEVSAY
ncbi:MAG: stage II sporulation protein D [Oscillospiraceae bacterium]|nr:stage II sporulation protein D [Oscillospiraceae bacterium]